MKILIASAVLLLAACGPDAAPPAERTAAATPAQTTTATSSCSARNDTGKQCSVTCEAGLAAKCRNSAGSAEPSCTCTSISK